MRKQPTPTPRRDPDRPNAEPSLSPDRLAESWELEITPADKTQPKLRDRIDPAKLKIVLTSLADLWVEGFLTGDKAKLAETGLDKPEQKLTITKTDGKTLTLLLGKITRTKTVVEEAPRPQPGMPPTPAKTTTEEYRAAKLAENDLVFELRTDKLPLPYSKPDDDYRDTRLARFDASEVQSITVAMKGQPPVTLVKKPGNKNADKDDDKQDRWTLAGEQLAKQAKSPS